MNRPATIKLKLVLTSPLVLLVKKSALNFYLRLSLSTSARENNRECVCTNYELRKKELSFPFEIRKDNFQYLFEYLLIFGYSK